MDTVPADAKVYALSREDEMTGLKRKFWVLNFVVPPSLRSQTLLTAFKAKCGEADPIPESLRDRITALLVEARNIFAQFSIPSIGMGTAKSDATFLSHDSGEAETYSAKMTVKTLDDLEGVFDTEAGVDVENEELCSLVRAAIGR